MARDNQSVASCQHAGLLLVGYFNRLVASWLFQQACCNLFQQVVKSLQMTICNKPDLNRLVDN